MLVDAEQAVPGPGQVVGQRGPIPMPMQVTALCEPGWDIGGVVAIVAKAWRLVELSKSGEFGSVG